MPGGRASMPTVEIRCPKGSRRDYWCRCFMAAAEDDEEAHPEGGALKGNRLVVSPSSSSS